MSWEQLLQIQEENRAFAEEDATSPPVACPYDGTPLEPGPRGELHCSSGDYEWPRDNN